MEYLTLQDIPQRHCNTVHSHRMTSQSSERPVGHMAAVCSTSSSSAPPPNTHCLLPPHHPIPYGYVYRKQTLERVAAYPVFPPLKEIELPAPSISPPDPSAQTCPSSESSVFCKMLDDDITKSQRTILPPPQFKEDHLSWVHTKTASQNHLQRSSPPLQPGEQQSFPGKLPSFNEVSTVAKLSHHCTNLCSSCIQPLKEHPHTHRHAEMTLQKTLPVCGPSSTT